MSAGTEVIINTARVEAQIIASGIAVTLVGETLPETIVGLPGPAGPKGADGTNGIDGAPGVTGPVGADGTNGAGLSVGGLTGQVPVKLSGTDYDLGWFSGLSLDPVTGRVGVGTNAPQSQFDINAVGTAQTGLNIKTDINVNVFQYKKNDGSNLLRATYDGFNFHHYFGSHVFYNLAGKFFTISGNGQPSFVSLTNGARLFLDTDNIGALANLNIGALGSSYATAAVPLSKTVAIATNTWAWNGVSGSVIRSLLTQTQTQRSANAGDAIFEFVSNDFGTILSMDLLSGYVGIGTNAPSTTLHVNGPVRVGSYTVATVPSAISAGEGAMIYVTNEIGGPVMVFSDGANWRRMTDRAVVG